MAQPEETEPAQSSRTDPFFEIPSDIEEDPPEASLAPKIQTRLTLSHGLFLNDFLLSPGGENNLTPLLSITVLISSLTKKENNSPQFLLSIVLISSTLLPNSFGLRTKHMNGRLFLIVFLWIMTQTLSLP